MKTFISLALLVLVHFSYAQDIEVQINPDKVTDNIYLLYGAGGNIGLFLGEDGAVMIDDQFAKMSDKIMSVVDSLSETPIRYLINTHWHGDHTGGNAYFAEKGATIVAHENVRERLSHDQIRPFGRSTEAAPEIAWPTLTYNDEMQIHINGESLQLIHHHNAHTDGDAFIYFPSYNVLHMGDCFFRNRFPFIDVQMGGSPDGLIEAVAGALMLCDEDTKIIPGHGILSDKQDLLDYHQMLKIMRDRVKAEIKKTTAEDALDFASLTKGFEAWGTGFISGEKFVKTLYKAYMEE